LRSRASFLQSPQKLLSQKRVFALDTATAADHHMVRPRMTANGHDFASERPETALHAVADDGLADLLADGESDALRGIAVVAVADEEDESRHRRAPTGVRSEKVRAFAEDG